MIPVFREPQPYMSQNSKVDKVEHFYVIELMWGPYWKSFGRVPFFTGLNLRNKETNIFQYGPSKLVQFRILINVFNLWDKWIHLRDPFSVNPRSKVKQSFTVIRRFCRTNQNWTWPKTMKGKRFPDLTKTAYFVNWISHSPKLIRERYKTRGAKTANQSSPFYPRPVQPFNKIHQCVPFFRSTSKKIWLIFPSSPRQCLKTFFGLFLYF